MRWIILLLLLLLFGLQYKLWFDEGGLHRVQSLRHEIEVQKLQDEELVKQNDQLRAEVKDLKQGVDAAQERARTELGMIKQNEEYIQVVQPRPKSS